MRCSTRRATICPTSSARSTANTRSGSIAGTPASATRSSSGSHRCWFSVKNTGGGGGGTAPRNRGQPCLRRDATEWPWSTHRATAGLEDAPAWLHLDWLRWAFGADGLPDAQRRYELYVRDPAGVTWSFDETTALGTTRFKTAVAEFLWRAQQTGPTRAA